MMYMIYFQRDQSKKTLTGTQKFMYTFVVNILKKTLAGTQKFMYTFLVNILTLLELRQE